MGEARKDALRLDFDLRLKLEFHCDEPSVEIEQCGEVLQQARHIKSCSRANFQQSGFESGISCYFKGYIVRLLLVYEENYVC